MNKLINYEGKQIYDPVFFFIFLLDKRTKPANFT